MWNNTRKKPRVFSADSMPALRVRVPEQQGNSSECGIYVLLYAEQFLNDPPKELVNELDCTSWFIWLMHFEGVHRSGIKCVAVWRVHKEDLPKELREQRPKKAKTKVSIFSALSEGEATDLAQEPGAMLEQHVHLDDSANIPSAEAEVVKNSLCTIEHLLREKLGEESPFSLHTHTFGPQAVDVIISFLISQFM
ncbi:uncharacterized protein LOC127417753 isoform X2 [Myxocyprinus asiaticus]|nr:uncharacterized protein LOC127417753 isoform X2 [Myxocyprinus asiaticus]